MSGIQLTTEIDKNAFSVASIIKQIKESQQSVLKAFEEHNTLVNKSLEIIQQLKTETKVEVVKVKDPLEEIKNVKELFDRYELDLTTRCGFLTNIFNILLLYNKDKISASFKDIFLNILKRCLDINTDNVYISFHFKNQLKENILKVRDIRWLLLEMEKYPQYFQFTEDDLLLMKEHGASRDNIYLVKKFLKKDGDYEEMYEEEDGGGIKCRYHMTGGCLNGEYKEFYSNGSKKATRNYKEGELSGITEVWYENGIRSVYSEYNKGLVDGVYNAWYENGNPMYETNHLYNKRHGVRKDYYPNGQLSMIRNYINGVQVGEYKCWYEDGKLSSDIIYRDDGKIIKLECWNQSGILSLKKSLINYDTYEFSRYYECDGKIHDKVITEGDKWNGEYKSWWHNGNKCIETTYKDDKIHGDYTYWNEDGTLREKSVYKDGVKV
jgi:antitoxin component YwqK of YwqJK toxin-antitoxin module